ncbi:MAG: carbon-nitrogen hydrolase family protein [Planctomycetota bacterium]
MKLALAQLAPVFLDREATTDKAADAVHEGARHGARVVCFGEGLIPAYPLWLTRVDGARFDEPDLKNLHRIYLEQAVSVERGDLAPVQDAAKEHGVHVVLGIIERPPDRAGHSVFCSAVVIDDRGAIASCHRKLCPTYEERLAWAHGDANGLRAHPVGNFTLGALNCFENWMPLARAALHAQGEDLHVAIWPGCERLTEDITRFIAREGRSYVASCSSIIRAEDLPENLPLRHEIIGAMEVGGGGADMFYDGGSCVSDPRGDWVVAPVVGEETIIYAQIDHAKVLEERQIFDPSGHYARPELLRLEVDRRRITSASFRE